MSDDITAKYYIVQTNRCKLKIRRWVLPPQQSPRDWIEKYIHETSSITEPNIKLEVLPTQRFVLD